MRGNLLTHDVVMKAAKNADIHAKNQIFVYRQLHISHAVSFFSFILSRTSTKNHAPMSCTFQQTRISSNHSREVLMLALRNHCCCCCCYSCDSRVSVLKHRRRHYAMQTLLHVSSTRSRLSGSMRERVELRASTMSQIMMNERLRFYRFSG